MPELRREIELVQYLPGSSASFMPRPLVRDREQALRLAVLAGHEATSATCAKRLGVAM